ncbi:MAG: hypothetical protein H6931_17665 [Burkholderiaceae bacterium]|nr:hypothetical protein [Zoogloeaceae bacterium]MCP5290919.1 hypothetical protein [Burkholderiaceae bacterium]
MTTAANPPNAQRALIDLDVEFISLVDRPANGKPLVLKSAEGKRVHTFAIAKTDDEQMRAYGIVYAPGEVDSQGDTASADVIKRAANKFMRAGRAENVDKNHNFSREQAYVAESWIVRKGDPLFPDQVDAWAVGIQIGDPLLWRSLKSGDLTGLSLAGMAETEQLGGTAGVTKDDQPPGWFTKLFGNTLKTKENEMNEDDVRRIVGETVGDAVTKALAEAGVAKNNQGSDGAGNGAGGNAGAQSGGPAGTDAVTKADLTALADSLTKALKDGIADALTKGAGEGGMSDDRPTYDPTLGV